MATLNVLLYSTLDTQRYVYKDTDGVLVADIDSTFRNKCSVRSLRNHGALVEVGSETREALQDLENKYDIATHFHIRKLKAFISKLSDGQYFYYFDEEQTTVVERKTAICCINAMKTGLPWTERLHNIAFEYYSMMDIHFTYLSYGYDGISQCIGEDDKPKRVCRFCGKKMPDVTFDKDAHAIQDALGNKLLFCYEECDTCNHDLALTEDNFRYLMDFRRAIYNVPRKGSTKTPTIVGKTFIIKADAKGQPELYLMEESLPNPNERQHPLILHLELKSPINNERMYKALCKMVMDMMPGTELHHFKNTIEWITAKGEWIPDALPSALFTILPLDKINPQPILDIFINNRNNKLDAPYCTAIVWLYDIAYMFVVPFVDVDCGRYKYDRNLESHWNRMRDLIGIQEWQFQDTSEYHLSTPWVEWPIDLSEPNIYVLPKNDPIFEKSLEVKPPRSHVDMLEFNPAVVSLCQINSAQFTSYYKDALTDADLSDVTQQIKGPIFLLSPKDHKLTVSISVTVNDTTNQIKFFSFSYEMDFHIKEFDNYINVEYNENGEVESFAFHYEVSKYLLLNSFSIAEEELSKQRKGSQFENCSINKMGDIERIINHIHYYVPCLDGIRYLVICDTEIHGVAYCD